MPFYMHVTVKSTTYNDQGEYVMDILLEFSEVLLSYDGKKLGMFIIG